jgi:sigma-B regulation protein RsbU (phosphoserine phosphatase)
MTATNDYIGRTHSDANMFATVFFGVLDLASGTLWYTNGGHEAPAVLAADGSVRARLDVTGPAVGLMPDLAFRVAEAGIGPGEQLLAFTDGVLDARAPSGETFGEERMLRCAAAAPGAALPAIERGIAEFSAGEPAYDDVTMLSVRRAAAT